MKISSKALVALLVFALFIGDLVSPADAQSQKPTSKPSQNIFNQELAAGSLGASLGAWVSSWIWLESGLNPFAVALPWIGGSSLGAILGVTRVASLHHEQGSIPGAIIGSFAGQGAWIAINYPISGTVVSWGEQALQAYYPLFYWGFPLSAALGAAIGFNQPTWVTHKAEQKG